MTEHKEKYITDGDMITAGEVAKMTSLPRWKVVKYIRAGILPAEVGTVARPDKAGASRCYLVRRGDARVFQAGIESGEIPLDRRHFKPKTGTVEHTKLYVSTAGIDPQALTYLEPTERAHILAYYAGMKKAEPFRFREFISKLVQKNGK